MKAAVLTAYGSANNIKIKEVPDPIPENNELLIKIHTCTVSAADCEVRRFDIQPLFWLPLRLMTGLFKPRKNKILGQEFAGEVIAVGAGVRHFRIGDLVFGSGGIQMGCQAEYKCKNEITGIIHKPPGITFEEAVTIPLGGLNALHYLRKANITSNDRVLIIGAGGSIGTYAVQLASKTGAHITVVESGEKLEMLKAIGANKVIDYKKEDFWLSKTKYDVIFDVSVKTGYSKCISALATNGRYIPADYSLSLLLRGFMTTLFTSNKVIITLAGDKNEDLLEVAKLIENKNIKPVIGKTFSLEEIPEANRQIEKGLKQGSFVVRVS
ncbi:NAD(P)-dependent alcohol dehydrogenase [Mangrovivirga sp. M17]|uniref:NAD(P)-dependent alcohol dehydrogenase n=1 Tax=Mangrovivirga halotolerans TaxID=2993936 RepID=A0ABT3RWN0_9BACT|nr:NAD(P)-dependent alcohol dehydrogenase [Mangrovivirga halotolerans]MCX2745555.1 NAD(P)-dependent alcohol dehydrogenase [Mangrovivirga halotolerans]